MATTGSASAWPDDAALAFRGATVVDGTGGPARRADVLVSDGRIERIVDLPERAGRPGEAMDHPERVDDAPSQSGAHREIDARGLVLAPGFIDMHAHSDLALLADPEHLAKVSQGVTTEVIGQDGIGYAPVDDVTLQQVRRQIAGWNGNPPLAYEWRSFPGYLDRLAQGAALNAAVLVPQGNLRMLTVGQERRPATRAEIDRMCGILRDSLAAGGVGMSSGLTYTPGMYADTGELEALCRVVAEAGGYFSPHTRSYGAGALDAYAEVIGIARRAGCGLELTHATLNFAANRDSAPAFLDMVDAALADGVDLTMDTYPYLPGATTLSALLPSWFAAGGPEALLQRLASGADHDALVEALEVTGCDGFHGEVADWSAIQISGVTSPPLHPYIGRTVREIADDEGRAAVDVVVSILLEDELSTSVLMHIGHEHNVRAIMQHPVHCGGSDAILVGERPHPRAWGTFPRYLGRYVRELDVLSMEECVRHLSGTPARRLGLRNRGLVREGYAADLVLMDPLRVRDTATFESPKQQAEGIAFVIVNGRIALEDGARTRSLNGRVLRAAS